MAVAQHNCMNKDKYLEALRERQAKYGAPESKYPDILSSIEKDGFLVIPAEQLPIDLVESVELLKEEAEPMFEKNENTVSMTGGRFVKITQPFVNCRSTVPIAFHPLLASIASDYYGCKAAIGTVNLRKSFKSDLPPDGTTLYHTDRNAYKLLKFFFYLNDVGPDDGPFTYIRGSDNKKPPICDIQHRWKDEEVYNLFGKEREVKLTAKFGDMIIANTRGMHKGSMITGLPRIMFTVNYGIHPENWEPITFKVKNEDVANVPSYLTDFLIKV